YRADLAEVRAYGAVNSTVRTERQTETATFWFGSSLTLYTEPLRVAVARSQRSTSAQAALVALFHVAAVDTQIATSDTKYAYLRWRPVTAIRTGAIDPDPGWSPLHITPAHPDYPSGHNTYAGAAETARVYSGIHTRSADEAGLVLGKRVAGHALNNAALLFGVG
ncbi:vanadium-dependent haloperoxidase, partial [Streptomyces sp.]|uniref:vanadium-dependent haloperoxidase n=1 Tax=Streptomyces sp. TaxID=1931 RepID=UPI0025E0BD68